MEYIVTNAWIALGLFGQALFALRILVQWVASEREGRSIVPKAFWYISVPAGAILLSYAIWRRDPVFITNEAICLAIFIRNVILLRKAPHSK